MPQINWNLLSQFADPGQAVQQGIAQGYQFGSQLRSKNALAHYFQNQDDPQALNALASADPELAFKAQDHALQRRKYEREVQAQGLQQRAASGDQAAMAQLAGIDLDAWSKLDARAKAQMKDRTDFIGEAALQVSQLPEAERAARWDQIIDWGVQNGHPDLADYKGKYSPQALDGALTSAGRIKDFLATQKIEYHQQGERPSFATRAGSGELIDPVAVLGSGTLSGGPNLPVIASPEEARKLPPGTPFKTPDGRTLRVPGGASQGGSQTFP